MLTAVLILDIKPVSQDSLLNHMIFITKVGVSCVNHMNDDALEVNSSPPLLFKEKAWEEGSTK